MARTLRDVLHPLRSRLILSVWLALSTCFQKIMWPDEHVFVLHCEEPAQVALGEIELAQVPARGSSAPSPRSQEASGPVFAPNRREVSMALRLHEVNPTLVHFPRALSGVLS